MTNHLLSVVVFAPLAGALISWLVGRRTRNETLIGAVACGSVAVSAIAAFAVAFTGARAPLTSDPRTPAMRHLWTWLQVGGLRADFRVAMHRLGGIDASVITF